MNTWPQIILALYLALAVAGKFYEYGKDGRTTGIASPFVIAAILYWGGFWS